MSSPPGAAWRVARNSRPSSRQSLEEGGYVAQVVHGPRVVRHQVVYSALKCTYSGERSEKNTSVSPPSPGSVRTYSTS